jgi:hypothetical protein
MNGHARKSIKDVPYFNKSNQFSALKDLSK